MEEAKKVLQETRLPTTSANDNRNGRLDLSRMSNETLARDLYISTQMQLPSGAYRAAVEEEIRKRGYTIESMLRAADAATTWDKDQAWDMVRAALERQHPKSSSWFRLSLLSMIGRGSFEKNPANVALLSVQTRVHHASRWRGSVAARGERAAAKTIATIASAFTSRGYVA
jgi:hypothetical protein